MKKNINNHNIHTKHVITYKGGMEIRILKERDKECELTKGSRNAFERIEEGEK